MSEQEADRNYVRALSALELLERDRRAAMLAAEQAKREVAGMAEHNSEACDEIARLTAWIRHWQESGWVEDELQMAIDGDPSPAASPMKEET